MAELANGFITEHAPWAEKDLSKKRAVIRASLEAVYIMAHFLAPVLPTTADNIFACLGTPPVSLSQLKDQNLKAGASVVRW